MVSVRLEGGHHRQRSRRQEDPQVPLAPEGVLPPGGPTASVLSGPERVVNVGPPTILVLDLRPANARDGGPLEKDVLDVETTMVTDGVMTLVVALDSEQIPGDEATEQAIDGLDKATADVAISVTTGAANAAIPVPSPERKPRSGVMPCVPAVEDVHVPGRFLLHRHVARRPGSTKVRCVAHEWRRMPSCVRWPRRR